MFFDGLPAARATGCTTCGSVLTTGAVKRAISAKVKGAFCEIMSTIRHLTQSNQDPDIVNLTFDGEYKQDIQMGFIGLFNTGTFVS